MVISLYQGANNLHTVQLVSCHLTVSCFINIQIGLTLLVLAPEKEATKWIMVKTGQFTTQCKDDNVICLKRQISFLLVD